jgi:membrane protease YdiL (CAAX protease family)
MNTPDANPFFAQDSQTEAPASSPPAPPLDKFPEDLRVPWGWREALLFALFTLASYFFFAIVMIVIFQIRGVPPSDLKDVADAQSLFIVIVTVLISAAMMAYLFFTARVRFHAPFWRTLGWRPFPERIPRPLAYAACVLGGGIFAVVIGLASAAVGKKGTLPIEKLLQDRESTMLLMGLGILVAPLVEETIFRGFLYPLLARSFGITAGVLVTGTLFGLLHAGQLWGGWGQIALLVLVGIVFTYVRALSGTVLASYLLHVSYNTYLFAGLYFATSGFRHFPLHH